jgi:preprotein translocase subunit SecF
MSIIRFKWLFLSIAFVLVGGSAVLLGIKGIRLGTEFTGGAVAGITSADTYKQEDAQAFSGKVSENLTASSVDTSKKSKEPVLESAIVIIPVDAKTFELRLTDESDFKSVETALSEFPQFKIAYENVTGPTLGKELYRKSIIALALVLLAILVFIAFAFSGIDEARKKHNLGPSSWVYGFSALVALLHDVLIPTGIFILLGKEVTSLYVVGMLSILGLSVSDTIVVFDRIREHMKTAQQGESFNEIIDSSIKDTFTRSINTSLTIMLTLAALLLFGPTATHDLALVMLLGAFFGTYSSIFVASPLLTLFVKGKKK